MAPCRGSGGGIEQFAHLRNFIGLFFDIDLRDDHSFFVQDGAEQMRRALVCVVRAPQAFAVRCYGPPPANGTVFSTH